ERRHVVRVGELDRAGIARSIWKNVEPGIGHIEAAVPRSSRIVVDGDELLVVEERRVHLAGLGVDIRRCDCSKPPRRPGCAVVQRLEDVEFGGICSPEEAELSQIESTVTRTISDGGITAGAEVARRSELRRDSRALPIPAA